MKYLLIAVAALSILAACPACTTAQAASAKTAAAGKSPASRSTGRAKISEARAIRMIAARTEVRSWKHNVEASKMKGVTARVALDRIENGEYVIHVFEEVPDPDGSHTATMNWYYVNLRNGKVRAEF